MTPKSRYSDGRPSSSGRDTSGDYKTVHDFNDSYTTGQQAIRHTDDLIRKRNAVPPARPEIWRPILADIYAKLKAARGRMSPERSRRTSDEVPF